MKRTVKFKYYDCYAKNVDKYVSELCSYLGYESELITKEVLNTKYDKLSSKRQIADRVIYVEDGDDKFAIGFTNTREDEHKEKNGKQQNYHGNSYIIQGLARKNNTIFDLINNEEYPLKYLYLTDQVENDGVTRCCKALQTLGIVVIKNYKMDKEVDFSPFTSFEEFVYFYAGVSKKKDNKTKIGFCEKDNSYLFEINTKETGHVVSQLNEIIFYVICAIKLLNKTDDVSIFCDNKYREKIEKAINIVFGENQKRCCFLSPEEKVETEDNIIYNKKEYVKKTISEVEVKTFRNQQKFKESLRSKYRYKCAICGIGVPEVLDACHIIPIEEIDKVSDETNEELKLSLKKLLDDDSVTIEDGRTFLSTSYHNGLFLCKNHHCMFDKEFIYIDENGFICYSDDNYRKLVFVENIKELDIFLIEGDDLSNLTKSLLSHKKCDEEKHQR